MSSSKKSKSRGRPPKYVLDDRGKEVVGLSYNHTNDMYYATGTNPRHYFTFGNGPKRKEEAIRQFHEWKKLEGCSPDKIEKQKLKDEIHRKAVQLIYEGYYDKEIEDKARVLIADDTFVSEELNERAIKLLATVPHVPDRIRKLLTGSITNVRFILDVLVNNRAQELIDGEVKEWIHRGVYDADVYARLARLLETDKYETLKIPTVNKFFSDLIRGCPTKAAQILEIKEIVFVNVKYDIPLSWDLVWHIFYSHKDKNDYLYESKTYQIIELETLMVLDDLLLDNIKYTELWEALDPFPAKPHLVRIVTRVGYYFEKESKKIIHEFSKIPLVDCLEILKDVFTTVKNVGYNYSQVDRILSLISEFPCTRK